MQRLDKLEIFVNEVEKMRKYQKAFFQSQYPEDKKINLQKSKEHEKRVDLLIIKLNDTQIELNLKP